MQKLVFQQQNVLLASVFSKKHFMSLGTQGGRQGPQGVPRGTQRDISKPLWDINTPVRHGRNSARGDMGEIPTMRQGLNRMAWSSNPMEASPLGLRSVTVLPRALLEVSPDPPVGRRQQQQQTTATTTQRA